MGSSLTGRDLRSISFSALSRLISVFVLAMVCMWSFTTEFSRRLACSRVSSVHVHDSSLQCNGIPYTLQCASTRNFMMSFRNVHIRLPSS